MSKIVCLLLSAVLGSITFSGTAFSANSPCTNNYAEIEKFIKENDWFFSLHKQQNEEFRLLLKNSPKKDIAAEQAEACLFAKEVIEKLEQNNYKNIWFSDKPQRCKILREISPLYEKRENALALKINPLQELNTPPEKQYFTLVGNNLHLNHFNVILHESTSNMGSIPLKHLSVSAQDLGGECGNVELQFALFDKENGQAARLNQLIDSVTPKEILDAKHHLFEINKFTKAIFEEDNYEYSYRETIDFLDDHLLSLSYTIYTYKGGAHGDHNVNKYAFDLKHAKLIQLDDLFKEENMPAVLALAKKNFIKEYKLDPIKNLNAQGYWFSENPDPKQAQKWQTKDHFYLPLNFNADNEGITFIYQPYEITSYSAGTPTFKISWQELAPYLKEESVGRNYLH